MIKWLAILLFLSLKLTAFTQQKTHFVPLVEFDRYKRNGWIIGPGLSYMYPNRVKVLGGQENELIKPKGRIAIYFEAGRYHIFKHGGNIFNYLDYSIAYKRLSGSEKFMDQKAVFKQNYVLANFNLNNVIQIAKKKFIQNSLGINADYKFSERLDPSPFYTGTSANFIVALHYKFGMGFKVNDRTFVIPSVETPIVNAVAWEKGKSTLGIYSSRYRPVIFTLRIGWLKQPGRGSCPPVHAMPSDKDKQKAYEMGQ